MARSFEDARRWMRDGTALLTDCAATLRESDYDAPSALPGWTRRHVVAHVAANADALGNLVRWAATGTPTPMYASPEERAAGIAEGVRQSAAVLGSRLRRSAGALEDAMAGLTGRQWQAEVVTAQGRTVPATELPWMRSREVWVHAADLGRGAGFADLPADFLTSLCDDVVAKRALAPGPALVLDALDTGAWWELPGTGGPVAVAGSLADVAAYLTGRAHRLTSAPALPPWL